MGAVFVAAACAGGLGGPTERLGLHVHLRHDSQHMCMV